MNRLNEREALAVKRLCKNKDFELFLDCLVRSRDEKDVDNRRTDGIPLYRGQGAAIELTSIIDAIVES